MTNTLPMACQGCTLPCDPHHHNDVAVVCARGYGWSLPSFHVRQVDEQLVYVPHALCLTPFGRVVLCELCCANYRADYGAGSVESLYATRDACACCGVACQLIAE